jgi:hypothetical protein
MAISQHGASETSMPPFQAVSALFRCLERKAQRRHFPRRGRGVLSAGRPEALLDLSSSLHYDANLTGGRKWARLEFQN